MLEFYASWMNFSDGLVVARTTTSQFPGVILSQYLNPSTTLPLFAPRNWSGIRSQYYIFAVER